MFVTVFGLLFPLSLDAVLLFIYFYVHSLWKIERCKAPARLRSGASPLDEDLHLLNGLHLVSFDVRKEGRGRCAPTGTGNCCRFDLPFFFLQGSQQLSGCQRALWKFPLQWQENIRAEVEAGVC